LRVQRTGLDRDGFIHRSRAGIPNFTVTAPLDRWMGEFSTGAELISSVCFDARLSNNGRYGESTAQHGGNTTRARNCSRHRVDESRYSYFSARLNAASWAHDIVVDNKSQTVNTAILSNPMVDLRPSFPPEVALNTPVRS
jgi:hypothetical protein